MLIKRVLIVLTLMLTIGCGKGDDFEIDFYRMIFKSENLSFDIDSSVKEVEFELELIGEPDEDYTAHFTFQEEESSAIIAEHFTFGEYYLGYNGISNNSCSVTFPAGVRNIKLPINIIPENITEEVTIVMLYNSLGNDGVVYTSNLTINLMPINNNK